MVGRKKKTKTCDKVSQEQDCISKLPDHLMSEILAHLPTKDAVKTSLLSTRWRNLWQLVPGLDLDSYAFSNVDAFVSFTRRFFDSHKESWIRKLRLSDDHPYCKASLTQWMNAVTMRNIKHLDFGDPMGYPPNVIPLSIYTCQTLVHLRLCRVAFAYVLTVSLPCLKILDIEYIFHLRGDTYEKLISGSPVLEDLTIVSDLTRRRKVIQVRSLSLKRIHIDHTINVVIDAPLLQSLRTEIYSTSNYKIISLGFPTKLNIDADFHLTASSQSLIHDILSDILRVRDLVIRNVSWKQIFLYSNSGPVLQFRHLARLNATLFKSDREKVPTILESCPKLESLILELEKEPSSRHKINGEPKVMFSTVPECMVSSLKFVELKRSVSAYEGETELIRYILKNSTILKKLRLDNTYHTKKAKCAFLTEVMTMRRCSNACQVFVL